MTGDCFDGGFFIFEIYVFVGMCRDWVMIMIRKSMIINLWNV
jgi:hypothetical protein